MKAALQRLGDAQAKRLLGGFYPYGKSYAAVFGEQD